MSCTYGTATATSLMPKQSIRTVRSWRTLRRMVRYSESNVSPSTPSFVRRWTLMQHGMAFSSRRRSTCFNGAPRDAEKALHLTIRLIAVGKVRERYVADALADFRVRLRPYHRLEEVEVRAADGADPAR